MNKSLSQMPVNRQHPLNQELISWLMQLPHRRGGGGPLLRDLMNYRHGTLTGSMTSSDWVGRGRQGGFGSLHLDGTDDYIDLGTPGKFNFENTDPFSISFWARPDDNGRAFSWIKQTNAGDFDGYTMLLNHDGAGEVADEINIDIRSTASNLISVHFLSSRLNNGKWHQYTMTYDGSTNASGVSIYEDGIAQTLTIRDDTLTTSIQNSASYRFGVRGTTTLPFDGKMDDWRTWKRKLSAADALFCHKDSRAGYPDTLNWHTASGAFAASNNPWYYYQQMATG